MTSGVLPVRRTALIGRIDDLAAITERLEHAPVVTLTGMGGVGKTTLAFEVAARVMADGRMSVQSVELTPVTEGSSVPRVVADAVGLPAVAGRSAQDALIARFAGQEPTLLLLDNCEQVVDAVAELVDLLVSRCPEVTVLATSRARLDVEGESVWPVQPLAVDAEDPSASEAVQLLIARVEAVRPDALADESTDELVEIARRLDGLPLALELAAARLATSGAAELHALLEEGVLSLDGGRRRGAGHHRSMEDTIEWSYRLLDPDEQQLLCRLSVFSGGFTRAAAKDVAELDSARGLDRLVEMSLLTVGEAPTGTRYSMVESIREFSAARLTESDAADEARRRHTAWLVDMAEGLLIRSRGPDERAAADEFAAEQANIGAVLHRAIDADDALTAVRLVRSLQDEAWFRGSRVVHSWFRRVVDYCGDRPGHIDVVLVYGLSAMARGDLPEFRKILESIDALGGTGDEVMMNVPGLWGALYMFEGHLEESIQKQDEHAATVRAGDSFHAAYVYVESSLPRSYLGQTEEAFRYATRGLEIGEELDNPSLRAWANYAQGEALVGIDPRRAIDAYREALTFAKSANNHFMISIISVAFASALARHGEPVEALEAFREGVRRWQRAGAWSFLSTSLRNLGELFIRLDRYEDGALIRAALEALEDTSGVAGVDEERDQYLRTLLKDRLGSEGYREISVRAAKIDGAELTTYALEAIERELRARRSGNLFRAAAFTDLVMATAFTADHGDREAREIMRRYEELTDGLLERHGGELVKGTGDGVLATFPSVSAALACATDLLDRVDASGDDGDFPLPLRVGIHAGEFLDDRGDIHGTIVNLAARVVDRADGGEIMVTDTVRQIVIGSDHVFTDAGETELKGIPEPMRLHRLERG